jgi:hypothetical protein
MNLAKSPRRVHVSIYTVDISLIRPGRGDAPRSRRRLCELDNPRGAVPLHETALALLLLLRPLTRLKESRQTALLNKLEDGGICEHFPVQE